MTATANQTFNGNVSQPGHHNAGRDLIINEGFRINTRMRPAARSALYSALAATVTGTGLIMAYNLTVYIRIQEALRTGQEPVLPPANVWVPLGYALSFIGFVLLVVALAAPRDRTVTPFAWDKR